MNLDESFQAMDRHGNCESLFVCLAVRLIAPSYFFFRHIFENERLNQPGIPLQAQFKAWVGPPSWCRVQIPLKKLAASLMIVPGSRKCV